jgi:hypothetical protein
VRRGAPHGIIAIRSFLGRGSPQLISRFVREIGNGHAAQPPASRAIPDAVAAQLTRLWEVIRTEATASAQAEQQSAVERLADTEARHRQADAALQLERDRSHGLRVQNAALSDQLRRLQDELQRQQQIFTDWRTENATARALLQAGLEQANSRRSPNEHRDSIQLDLYTDGD